MVLYIPYMQLTFLPLSFASHGLGLPELVSPMVYRVRKEQLLPAVRAVYEPFSGGHYYMTLLLWQYH
jgi:hypothetical protein